MASLVLKLNVDLFGNLDQVRTISEEHKEFLMNQELRKLAQRYTTLEIQKGELQGEYNALAQNFDRSQTALAEVGSECTSLREQRAAAYAKVEALE